MLSTACFLPQLRFLAVVKQKKCSAQAENMNASMGYDGSPFNTPMPSPSQWAQDVVSVRFRAWI